MTLPSRRVAYRLCTLIELESVALGLMLNFLCEESVCCRSKVFICAVRERGWGGGRSKNKTHRHNEIEDRGMKREIPVGFAGWNTFLALCRAI